MFDDFEQINSGVEEAASPEPQTESATSGSAPAEGAGQGSTTTEEANRPFHEHPRFKELVEQKNQYAQRFDQLQREMAELRKAQAPKPTESKDALIERLKGIDPEFAERIEKLQSSLGQVDEFRQWKEQQEAERIRTQAVSMIGQWNTANKVPNDLQELYQSQIELAAMRDPNIGLHNLKQVYDHVHANMSKLLDGVKRAERESYVSNKKSDASVPTSTPKGRAPSPSMDSVKAAKNPAEAREAAVQSVLQVIRAQRNA